MNRILRVLNIGVFTSLLVFIDRSVVLLTGAKLVLEKQSDGGNLPGLEQIIELFLNILPLTRSKPLHEPIKTFLRV
jgi:hypothetical protein